LTGSVWGMVWVTNGVAVVIKFKDPYFDECWLWISSFWHFL